MDSKFGDALPEVCKAMMELANLFDPEELAQQTFGFYEQFRPKIPEGVVGWGAKGNWILVEYGSCIDTSAGFGSIIGHLT